MTSMNITLIHNEIGVRSELTFPKVDKNNYPCKFKRGRITDTCQDTSLKE